MEFTKEGISKENKNKVLKAFRYARRHLDLWEHRNLGSSNESWECRVDDFFIEIEVTQRALTKRVNIEVANEGTRTTYSFDVKFWVWSKLGKQFKKLLHELEHMEKSQEFEEFNNFISSATITEENSIDFIGD